MRRTWMDLLDDPAEDRHLVQFYEQPSSLQQAVAAWTAPQAARGPRGYSLLQGGGLLIELDEVPVLGGVIQQVHPGAAQRSASAGSHELFFPDKRGGEQVTRS